jgi:hypothetical protein
MVMTLSNPMTLLLILISSCCDMVFNFHDTSMHDTSTETGLRVGRIRLFLWDECARVHVSVCTMGSAKIIHASTHACTQNPKCVSIILPPLVQRPFQGFKLTFQFCVVNNCRGEQHVNHGRWGGG